MRTSVRALVAALALLAGALKTSGDFDVCNNIPCTRLNYGFTELELWYDLWGPGYWDGDTWVLEPLFEYTWDYDLALSYGYCDYRWDYELWYGDSEFILRTYSLNYVDNTLDPDPNVYWYPFDDTKVLEFGSWSPDPAGVCAGETFTQTRSVRSLHRTGLRNECGEERNVFEEIVNSTGSQDATGSLGVSAIAGPTVICPYADGNPAGFGCDGAHFSVLVTPARPNVVVNWTGGVNPGSSITDGNGMSIYTMRFLNSTSSDENRVVTATISGTSCPSVLPVLVRGLRPNKAGQ